MKTYVLSLWRLLFPRLCVACSRPLVGSERAVCMCCLFAMHRTEYYQQPDNYVEQLFWGKVPIERAMAWCYFAKGGTLQKLLHALKYRNCSQVGVELGRQMAIECGAWYADVDAIIPIPLHRRRQRNRGYNQAQCVAQGVADVVGIPVLDQGLRRCRCNETQTHKDAYQRWKNTAGIFEHPIPLDKRVKHVLLVDDVITTGATLLSAAQLLHQQYPELKISIATLAVALAK